MKKTRISIITNRAFEIEPIILKKFKLWERIKILFGFEITTTNYYQLLTKKGIQKAEKLFKKMMGS